MRDDILSGEIWAEAYNFDSDEYEVSSLGRIRHKRTGTIKRYTLSRDGSALINLYSRKYKCVDQRRVGRLVYESFTRETLGRDDQVVFVNGKKTDCRLVNLMVMGRKDAIFHRHLCTRRRRRMPFDQLYFDRLESQAEEYWAKVLTDSLG